ncbi:uncharacterized protein LOC118428440 [Branchiostoma floridae]|uniref:Uncharacterized protein LOC118428440 n=1 Tax=Branchiostoma floridae TaxID=7739 RepID=A0A9J7N5T9_BRAFL|nr:uncharacterized protein LOC118428440 [Branchiostoma floridae]
MKRVQGYGLYEIKASKDQVTKQHTEGPHQPQSESKDNDLYQSHDEDLGNHHAAEDHQHQPSSEVDIPDWIYPFMMVVCFSCMLFSILPYFLLYRKSKTTVKTAKEVFRLELRVPHDQDLKGKKVQRSVPLRIDSTIDPSFDAGPEVGAALNQLVKEMESKMLDFILSLKSPLKTRKYDCFIIYSSNDEDFVYNKLIPFFKKNNIKYCEHQEHFELGKDIFANANSCIECSRRVVAVLSKSFFESGFCMADLNAARGYAAENNVQDFVISVKITNCDIPDRYADMKRSTYADLSEDVDDSKTWSQIRKAFTDVRLASVRIEMSFECHNEPDVAEVVPGQEI